MNARIDIKLRKWSKIPAEKGLDKHGRPRLDCFFPVCYSDTHYVHFNPENQHFNGEQKEKSVRNFRNIYVLVNADRFAKLKTNNNNFDKSVKW